MVGIHGLPLQTRCAGGHMHPGRRNYPLSRKRKVRHHCARDQEAARRIDHCLSWPHQRPQRMPVKMVVQIIDAERPQEPIADTNPLSAKQYATLLVRLAMSRIRALSITAIQLVLASIETGGLPSAGFHAALVRLLAPRAVRRRARLAVWATAQWPVLPGARLAVALIVGSFVWRVGLGSLARRGRLGHQQRQERPGPSQTTQRLPP